jgi:hypothetical protein
LGKATWQVEQLVWYFLDHAGIDSASTALKAKTSERFTDRKVTARRDMCASFCVGAFRVPEG